MSAVIDDKVGRKAPLSSPSQSVRDFAKLLNELEKDRSLLKLLSENCKERQMELSWEEKAEVMVEWYKKVFENPPVLPLLIKLAALGNLKVNFHCAHWHSFFPLREGPPLISVFSNSLYDPFGSPCRGQKRRSEPLRYKVGGASEPSPGGYAGWDRLGKGGDNMGWACYNGRIDY